jgi:hypothetical protein
MSARRSMGVLQLIRGSLEKPRRPESFFGKYFFASKAELGQDLSSLSMLRLVELKAVLAARQQGAGLQTWPQPDQMGLHKGSCDKT